MSDLIKLYDESGERVGTYCIETGRAQIGMNFFVVERTCRVELIDTGNEAAYEHYEYIAHCHSCHHEFGYVLYNEDGDTWQDELPNFCPNCGARVID